MRLLGLSQRGAVPPAKALTGAAAAPVLAYPYRVCAGLAVTNRRQGEREKTVKNIPHNLVNPPIPTVRKSLAFARRDMLS